VDGETGILISPRNSEEIAHAINELLSDSDKAKAFGESGYKRAKKFFDIKQNLEETMRVYDSLSR
jgi:glycosyltransferase involved in cell wall biosynthesis